MSSIVSSSGQPRLVHGYIHDFPVLDAEVVGLGLICFIHCCGEHELMCRCRCGRMSVCTSCVRDVRVWAKALEIKPGNRSQLEVASEIHINSGTMWTELGHIFSFIALNIPYLGVRDIYPCIEDLTGKPGGGRLCCP